MEKIGKREIGEREMEEMEEMEEISCKEAREWVESPDPSDRLRLAGAKLPEECAGEIYPKLIKDKNVRVRRRLARNKNIPKEWRGGTYIELSKDENPRVRGEVAANPAIPGENWEEIFKGLERDGDQRVLKILQLNLSYKTYKDFEQGKRIG